MGNEASSIRRGTATGSRSGEPIPKLPDWGKAPKHKNRTNKMSLTLHLEEIRNRTSMTPPEREWRKKWVMDQRLHPDEPIRVEAVYRQLNPIRRFYRWPWDKLYELVLEPKFGTYTAHYIRAAVPKFMIGYLCVVAYWYHIKYEQMDWQSSRGTHAFGTYDEGFIRRAEIEKEHPGLYELAMQPPMEADDYLHSKFKQRTAELNVGQTHRPW